MDDLTKKQMVFLVLLVSIVTSIATVVFTISLLEQLPRPTETILQRVVDRVAGASAENAETNENIKIISDNDMVVAAVEATSPAVVSVIATKDVPKIEQYYVDPFGNSGFLVPRYREQGMERREIGRGSGFIVSEDGYVATNKHVVTDTNAEYTIILNSGKTYAAKVMARDPVQDVAILKVDASNLPAIKLGNSDSLKIGEKAIAIGNALGEFQNTVSVGVISGLGRTITASGPGGQSPEELHKVIQTDAAINPGNSGGPLINIKGEVIGINTATVSGAENIGFALPVNVIKNDLAQVKNTGRISYPYLGVRYILITEVLAKERNLGVDYGVLIDGGGSESAIMPNSPAAKTGLREGDVILEFNGIKINKDRALADMIHSQIIGSAVSLKVLRNGSELLVQATLAERP